MNVLDGLTGVELDELSSSLICGLDLLEVLRYPRFVSNEDRQRETTLDTSGLMEEINCAICCGIIQKCVVIKACLHRFCSECISKAMRTGTNECPKCRKRIPSKRAYVPDPLYDSIILSIIPNVKVFEEMCYAFLMAFNKGRENDPTLEAIRHTFLEGGQHVKLQDVTSLHSAIGESGLSIECAFDKKQYMKEIIIRRRKILDAMPESPGVLRTCYKLEASGQDIPQVQPNVEPWFVAKPTQTLAYIRQTPIALRAYSILPHKHARV
ncbi:hypothetical protein BgAZ_110320 [Babesia gibsoni]|uniref:RING-type E3 ubiquitin transferase n=1 Tax=Babesia gibsoni TaxID=33632 RepID=A0AAD8PGU3_BABGI|nr:hypothetical protein BgAZ_110320 [Babesia gibsoni]